MPKTTCCLPRRFGVLIGVYFGLLSAPSVGWAQTIATLNLRLEGLPLTARMLAAGLRLLPRHYQQPVCADVVLADVALRTGAALAKVAFANQIVVPQEKKLAQGIRRAMNRRVASTQS